MSDLSKDLQGSRYQKQNICGIGTHKTFYVKKKPMPSSGCISRRVENKVSKRYLHTQVHNRTIPNIQQVKETQMSIDR